MALISIQDIKLAFGGPLLFDGLNLQIEAGERIALLGRNGVGKTTLMKTIAGGVQVDEGEIVFQKGIRITHLPQEVPLDINGKVFDIVLSGLGARAKLLHDYHEVSHRLQTEHTDSLIKQLDRLQQEITHTDSWDLSNEVDQTIVHMKLDPDADFATLSGGQKRRTLLARALVLKPDVLLLDEPTNHLDIESIDWLEEFLKTFPGTLFFVTHDRMFMTHLATRIVELDRGKIFNWSCDYQTFLERKAQALEVEAAQRVEFDKKLAEEEVWIRRGVKARRTRNEGRVKALERMRETKKQQRQLIGQARMVMQESESSGHLVIKTANLGFSYGDLAIVKNFSTQIMRGDKIGVLGPNGCGKTTLLRLLLGQLEPQQGKVRLGTNLEIAYYDQMREQLDEERTVIENVATGGDTVMINGKPRHVIGYLQDFLFTPDRARTPVKVLSGGERNRLFLARMFTKPSNLLIMDEPTNDLDIETQELLEELLMDYSGTLLLVSHDRSFLNNVVTSTIVVEGNGNIGEYAGGYDDWLNIKQLAAQTKMKQEVPAPQEPSNPVVSQSKRGLTSKEQLELEQWPKKIEVMEKEQDELSEQMAEINLDPTREKQLQQQSAQLATRLSKAYERWEYLEKLNTDVI